MDSDRMPAVVAEARYIKRYMHDEWLLVIHEVELRLQALAVLSVTIYGATYVTEHLLLSSSLDYPRPQHSILILLLLVPHRVPSLVVCPRLFFVPSSTSLYLSVHPVRSLAFQ